MFTQFRIRYPQGSLISELVTIDHGKYVVRTLVQADGITLATGLAAADNLEQAEDRARNRALAILDLNGTSATPEESAVSAPDSSATPKISAPPNRERELAHPATQKPEIPPTTTARDLPHHTSDEYVDSSSPSEKLELTIPEQDRSGDGLTSLLPEIPTTQTSPEVSPPQTQPKKEEEIPVPKQTKSKQLSGKKPPVVEPTEKETLITQESLLDGLTTTVPVDTPSEATTVSDEATVEVPEVEARPSISTTGPIDFSDIIAKSNMELKRLNWTNEQGRDYLLQTYGKRSRQLLSDEELLEFLQYLESQPTPET